MKLSVIIPVYNEGKYILQLLDKVNNTKINKEIIIVDDHSVDGTWDLLKKLEKKDNMKIIRHSSNLGKGAAIKTAIKEVTGDMIIIQDGDLEYDPADYPELIKPIVEGEVSVVYGSRVMNKNNKSSYLMYSMGGRLLSLITSLLYGSKITDEPTCYKVFKAKILKNMDLKRDGFGFCPEVTAKILKQGIKIKEVPIKYYPRKLDEGKKITAWDGFKAIMILLKYRFSG